MKNTLTCPDALFRELVRQASSSAGGSALVECGLRTRHTGREWLVIGRPGTGPSRRKAHALRVHTGSEVPPEEGEADGWLSIREAGGAVLLRGEIRDGGTTHRLHALNLVGPGMHRLPVGPARPGARHTPFGSGSELEALALERWDRTVGAVGGAAEWFRLISLRVGVAGCGRSGSIAAMALARLGIRELVLVDPDVVQLHNLGEMAGLTAAHIGRAKAAALASVIQAELSGVSPAVMAVTEPVQSPLAISALGGCDILISSPDNDAPRVALGIVACLYHRVLIDIGSGVHGEPESHTPVEHPELVFGDQTRQWCAAGADVRLVVPGADGCLMCRAGLADYEGAIDALCNRREISSRVIRPGRRLGSLVSLNQTAAGGIAVQMLIDLVAGRLTQSTSARLDLGRDGRLRLDYVDPSVASGQPESCSVCGKAGLGDLAL